MLGASIEWYQFTLSFAVPWPSSWGELPALWMIFGGLTLIYIELQAIVTCSYRSIRQRRDLKWYVALLALTTAVLLWPCAVWMTTKYWRENASLNKHRRPEWDDDL